MQPQRNASPTPPFHKPHASPRLELIHRERLQTRAAIPRRRRARASGWLTSFFFTYLLLILGVPVLSRFDYLEETWARAQGVPAEVTIMKKLAQSPKEPATETPVDRDTERYLYSAQVNVPDWARPATVYVNETAWQTLSDGGTLRVRILASLGKVVPEDTNLSRYNDVPMMPSTALLATLAVLSMFIVGVRGIRAGVEARTFPDHR